MFLNSSVRYEKLSQNLVLQRLKLVWVKLLEFTFELVHSFNFCAVIHVYLKFIRSLSGHRFLLSYLRDTADP